MTRASIWDIRDMRCGPMMTAPASPRKIGGTQAPIGSPRLARAVPCAAPCGHSGGSARLSTIGRIALRDRPTPQQHSAALYGGGRLWPGRFAEPGCADRPPVPTSKTPDPAAGSRPQSARGVGNAQPRSASAPRYPSAAQRTCSLPRNLGGGSGSLHQGAGPPRAASSLDCHSSQSKLEARVAAAGRAEAATAAMLGKPPSVPEAYLAGGSTTALQEDLGVQRKVAPVASGASLLQAVETLLSGKLGAGVTPRCSQSPRGLRRTSLGTKVSVAGTPVSPHRNMTVQTIMDGMVLYAEPEADETSKKNGLGSVQPKGRAQVMQQWLRPESLQSQVSGSSGSSLGRPPRPSESLRPVQLRSATAQAAALAPESGCSVEMDWSCLSDTARQALKQWAAGQLGGRHCMLILEQGAGGEALLMPPSSEEPSMSDLRGGAALNVLSGLFAEVGLVGPGEGGWLFEAVFAKNPIQVLEEALQAALQAIGDSRLERTSDLSPEQANLALRRLSMKMQFDCCTNSLAQGKSASGPRSSDQFTRIQVWLELLRLNTEGWPSALGSAASSASIASKDKDRPQRASEKAFHDTGVLKELGKPEADLEAESTQMSLDALREQNRCIEEYVMRLVRQRDELKQITKLAEERDSYFILGLVSSDVTDEEVKKAYRNLARREHPDKAGIANKKRFQAIQNAYTSILKHRREGGSSTVTEAEGQEQKSKTPSQKDASGKEASSSAFVAEAARYVIEARDAADRIALCAHRTLRSWEEGAEVQGQAKRRALRTLRDLTRQSASEIRGSAQQLRTLGHAIEALVRCSEAMMTEHSVLTNTTSAGIGIRDRATIVEDAGRSATGSAELLERICDATEATLKKVEKASPDIAAADAGAPQSRAPAKNDEAAGLVKLGVRLLTESLARTAAVARRTADEAIGGAIKALDLHRGLLMLDSEARKEKEHQNSKRRSFDEDDAPVAAGDCERDQPKQPGSEDDKETGEEPPPRTPRDRPETSASQTPRDQLKSAAKRVKDRHIALRVKNLRFLSSLNEEALRVQGRLWSLLERSDGALLPEISVVQKGRIFDLVSQLLDFALSESSRLAGNLAAAPVRVLEKSLSFALALEHIKEIAMPVDSRTQALKLAALIDTDLLCQVIGGPFRRRLIAIGAKRRGPEAFNNGGGYVQAAYSRVRGGAGPAGSAAAVKAWEEASNTCVERIARNIREATHREVPFAGGEEAGVKG